MRGTTENTAFDSLPISVKNILQSHNLCHRGKLKPALRLGKLNQEHQQTDTKLNLLVQNLWDQVSFLLQEL